MNLDFLTVFIFSAALLSTAAVIPFLLLSKIVIDELEKIYKAYLLTLSSMFFLNLSFYSALAEMHFLHKSFELVSLILFMGAIAIFIKKSANLYLLMEHKKQLKEEVKAKTKELEKRVLELEKSRTAMIHILKDLDKSKKELEFRAKDLEMLHTALSEFSDTLEAEKLIKKIPSKIRFLVGGRKSGIALLDERRQIRDLITDEDPVIGLGSLTKRDFIPLVEKAYSGSIQFPPDAETPFLFALLKAKGKPYALLLVSDKEGGYTLEDKALLKAAVLGAESALNNAILYEDLGQAYLELLDLDRLKTDIISNVTHELRTPITIAKTSLELLVEEDSKEERGMLIEMADNALKRLNNIVEDLIVASDVHSGHYKLKQKPIDLKASLREVLSRFRASKNGMTIQEEIPTDLPRVKGDAKSVRRVLENLLENAKKFSKKEGAMVEIRVSEEPRYVKTCIEDNGVGIPPEKLNEIFKPLYQLDPTTTRDYGGTGMGLAVARSLVEAMDGKIWAESTFEKGTQFFFTLPKYTES